MYASKIYMYKNKCWYILLDPFICKCSKSFFQMTSCLAMILIFSVWCTERNRFTFLVKFNCSTTFAILCLLLNQNKFSLIKKCRKEILNIIAQSSLARNGNPFHFTYTAHTRRTNARTLVCHRCCVVLVWSIGSENRVAFGVFGEMGGGLGLLHRLEWF